MKQQCSFFNLCHKGEIEDMASKLLKAVIAGVMSDQSNVKRSGSNVETGSNGSKRSYRWR